MTGHREDVFEACVCADCIALLLHGFAVSVESRQSILRLRRSNLHMNEELAAYITRLCELSGHTTWITKDLIPNRPAPDTPRCTSRADTPLSQR